MESPVSVSGGSSAICLYLHSTVLRTALLPQIAIMKLPFANYAPERKGKERERLLGLDRHKRADADMTVRTASSVTQEKL